MVVAAHGSGLLLGSQIKGDHLFHPLLGPAMGPQALRGPDPIELHAQFLGNPAGQQHLSLSAGATALGNHRPQEHRHCIVYKYTDLCAAPGFGGVERIDPEPAGVDHRTSRSTISGFSAAVVVLSSAQAKESVFPERGPLGIRSWKFFA
jgi:hypothetical protein